MKLFSDPLASSEEQEVICLYNEETDDWLAYSCPEYNNMNFPINNPGLLVFKLDSIIGEFLRKNYTGRLVKDVLVKFDEAVSLARTLNLSYLFIVDYDCSVDKREFPLVHLIT